MAGKNVCALCIVASANQNIQRIRIQINSGPDLAQHHFAVIIELIRRTIKGQRNMMPIIEFIRSFTGRKPVAKTRVLRPINRKFNIAVTPDTEIHRIVANRRFIPAEDFIQPAAGLRIRADIRPCFQRIRCSKHRLADIDVGRRTVKYDGLVIDTILIDTVVAIDRVFVALCVVNDLLPSQSSGAIANCIHGEFVYGLRQRYFTRFFRLYAGKCFNFVLCQCIVVDQQIVQQALEHMICERRSSFFVPSGTDQKRDLPIGIQRLRRTRFDSFTVYIQSQFVAIVGHSHMLPLAERNRARTRVQPTGSLCFQLTVIPDIQLQVVFT